MNHWAAFDRHWDTCKECVKEPYYACPEAARLMMAALEKEDLTLNETTENDGSNNTAEPDGK